MHPGEKAFLPSYGRRRGRRMRGTGHALMEEVLPKLKINLQECRNVEMRGDGLSALLHFPDSVPLSSLWLEIGFGSGEHLLAQARTHPDTGLIGCETYTDGIKSLLGVMAGSPPANLRLFTDDARLLLERLPDACLARVFILFPDPWPKTRHHKRRLIQKEFLDILVRVMKPGAPLRLATDHPDYLEWMLARLLAHEQFIWRNRYDWHTPPANWVRTRYQEKAEKEGRYATWLEFERCANTA